MKEVFITRFDGAHRFLSNFWMAEVEFEGMIYPSSEHAYQAAKTLDLTLRRQIQALPRPGLAKNMGKRLTLRNDWDWVKLEIMAAIVWDKFQRHPDLAQKLLDTENAKLIEGNTWGDRFWGMMDGTGENHLGRILMALREELRRCQE